MKKRCQVDKQRAVQKFRRLATEVNPTVQMMLPMAGIVGLLQEGVGHLMREAGLLIAKGCALEISGRGDSGAFKRRLADKPDHLTWITHK
jgi:hypothetical protein